MIENRKHLIDPSIIKKPTTCLYLPNHGSHLCWGSSASTKKIIEREKGANASQSKKI